MSALLLASHNDDETLFAAFTIIRHQPTVVVCFKSQLQEDRYGITAAAREVETERALGHLGGPAYVQSTILDTDPRAELRLRDMLHQHNRTYSPQRVWAPALEKDGQEQHSLVAAIAIDVFGDKVMPYLTYTRGQGRTVGQEVPFNASWVGRKLRALACYESQHGLVDHTQFWFVDDGLREYVPLGGRFA